MSGIASSGIETGGLMTAEAIGLLRSGATPEAAWWEAFGVGVDGDGAPEVGGIDLDEATALRAAGRLAHRSGAPLADILERIEEAERGRRRAAAAREVALAGPRASARVLLWLPAVGWFFALILDPGAATVLVATPLGWLLLVMGGGMWWVGSAWLRRMVACAEAAGSDATQVVLPLVLVEAAVVSGLDVRSALADVGHALGPGGAGLVGVSESLAAGAAWSEAWEGAGFAALDRALRSSWFRGASPAAMLRAAQDAIVEGGREAAEREAARLGVRATLPLSLCLLPAFIVLGVMPLVVALVTGIGMGW
ncbi:MAG: hypothetical protein JW722_02425 [Demequinaceae bacterium]|nr:hypothetical protein [Demequinaceae bacterium]